MTMKKFRLKLTMAFSILLTISIIVSAFIWWLLVLLTERDEWASLRDMLPQLSLYYVLAIGAMIFIAVLISYHIAEGMIKPLKNIMIVAQQISQSNYHARVAIHSDDEFGQLGAAINRMAKHMEGQVRHIRENEHRLESVLGNMASAVIMIDKEQRIAVANRAAERLFATAAQRLLGKVFTDVLHHDELIGLIHECIAYRKPLKDELVFYAPLERTLEINLAPVFADYEWLGVVIVLHDITEIRRLERVRSEFVANVSHELKTPIASVQGFAETLLRSDLEDKQTAQSFLQIIYDESERLNRLINDILQLSALESQDQHFEFEPVDLHQLFTSVLPLFAAQAEQRNVDIVMDVEEGLYIEANEHGMRQIFTNLISNAINYMPHGGTLTIAAHLKQQAEQEEEMVILQVADTGIGIPKKHVSRIFERFYLVDQARSRQSGGTGLGLSIVKHLVELHRGTISVQSEVGSGTTMTIHLPVIQPNG